MNIKQSKQKQRGKRKSKKSFSKNMRFLGVNSAGLRPKLMTFKKVLRELQPSVFFVEETKYKDVGKLKLPNYEVFELVRQGRDGGGLALGCQRELQPAWVREGDDQVEALSVDIFVKNMKIRCCVAYGCQENELLERKEAFWRYLDKDVFLAEQAEAGFILHFDGNLWAGNKIIPGDPRPQNYNGKMFQNFLERNPHLNVVNALPNCEGIITRSRLREGMLEESVLDFFVICNKILPFLSKMVIDERKKHILTNYQRVKRDGKASDSDHYTQYMDLNLKYESIKPERIEIYNYKNKEGQKRFNRITSETSEFSNCFKSNVPLLEQINNWQKFLNSSCKKAFSKIRIKNKKFIHMNEEILKLINKRNEILNLSDDLDKKEQLEAINHKISDMEAEYNRKMLVETF